jgi:hypothetical protein
VGVVALLVVVAGGDFASAGAGAGKYNSMTQMKTVEPCTAETTLSTVAESTATLGDTITYTVTETNNAAGSCLLDTDLNGSMDTLRVTGTFVLENRSGGGSGHVNNPCDPLDPRATCVLDVVDWVETHESGAGNNWNVLNDTDCVGAGCGLEKTISGNQLDGKREVDAYCPSHDASGNDSRGPMPDLDGDTLPGGGNTLPIDKCSPDTQSRYGTLVTELAPNTSLPCGQPGGSSCFGAPQVYNYTLTVDITSEQADLLASGVGIRNVAHFDMFNEQLTSSGRNHFTRASFSGASLDSNAYNVTVTDGPANPPNPPDDSCTPLTGFTSCAQTATGWTIDGATLASGASGTAQVTYKVRDDDCFRIIGNTVTATHTGAIEPEGPETADTTIECAYLTVNKDLKPGTDPGLFNLNIDGGPPEATDVGVGGTTGKVLLATGPHTAGETAGTGTDLANYETATGGDCAANGSIDLAADDDETCTITNLRKPKLTLEKQLVPGTDPGLFNLNIDGGPPEATDQGDGGTTGPVEVSIGQHAVSESAGTGTNMADYLTPSIGGSCTDNGDGTGSIALGPGDEKTCVITNTKVPTLTVVKTLEPTTDSGTFRLKIDGSPVTDCLGATSSAAIQVSINSHTVSEEACGGTSLADYTVVIDGDCDAGGNVTVAAGENKTCTITNSRKPTLEVRKVLSPDTDPGKFNLQIDTVTKAANVGDGGTTGALVVTAGAHTVGETAGTGTNLADYDTVIGGDCTAGGNVTLVAGDVKVCTITNTRKAAAYSSRTQGFWQGNNGEEKLDANGDTILDTPASIGDGIPGVPGGVGATISTLAQSQAILPGGTEVSRCTALTGDPDCWVGPPEKLMKNDVQVQLMGAAPQTLALTYNVVYLGGSTSSTLSSIDPCETDSSKTLAKVSGAVSTLGFSGATTIEQVLNRANLEIKNANSKANLEAIKSLLGSFVNCDRGADPPGDEDWDGVLDVEDNCVGANNPDQSDLDGDGIGDMCDFEADGDSGGVTVAGFDAFSDFSEAYMGTDPQRDCGLDAWGPDFNGDGSVDIFDVADIKAHFNTAAGNPAYTARDDLSADGYVNIVDLTVMKRFFLQTCAGVDPIQPGAP